VADKLTLIPHAPANAAPSVAILNWAAVVEDFLEPLGISLESFCTEFRGSWIFGYVAALQRVGVRPVVICVSKYASTPARFTHRPTKATIWILPTPRLYGAIHRRMVYPYGQTVREAFGEIRGSQRLLFPFYALAREMSLYLATPRRPLARVLRRERCKALLCQEYEYPRFDTCVLLGRLLRIPVFGCFQGGNYRHSHLERATRPVSIRACAGLIIGPVSEATRVRERYNVSARRIARIFNPVDTDVWRTADRLEVRAKLGISSDARVVVWHGRIAIDKKGLDILLDAWERVCATRRDGDLRLVLVGTGDDAEKFRRLLTAKQLPGVLWIDDFIHDPAVMRRYLSAADVYAFASRYEGFPIAPLEAMACGLPIVATDVEGIPEILAHEQASGGLVVPRNDPEALASALGRLLDDPSLSRELGIRARRRVEATFSLTATGERLRAFLGLAS
jgi:glycosyltransferase involved in cell wall biosynthesis